MGPNNYGLDLPNISRSIYNHRTAHASSPPPAQSSSPPLAQSLTCRPSPPPPSTAHPDISLALKSLFLQPSTMSWVSTASSFFFLHYLRSQSPSRRNLLFLWSMSSYLSSPWISLQLHSVRFPHTLSNGFRLQSKSTAAKLTIGQIN